MIGKAPSNPYQPLTGYVSFTPTMAINLAAPHTWGAAIMPVLIAVVCAHIFAGVVNIALSFILLAICLLMQSAVNTMNDYFDYVKGVDTAEDNVDISDSVLVYNKVNPRIVFAYALCLLGCAFLLGIYVIIAAGWFPLAMGALGAIVVIAYSAGKTPISYLPLGEVVSGVVMGGLIPFACYQALTNSIQPLMWIWALPSMVGVGLIMFTNNTCDLEKDRRSGRRTLAVLLGRVRTLTVYRSFVLAWIILIVGVVVFFKPYGTFALLCMLLATYPALKALFANVLVPSSRKVAMAQICSLNITLSVFYCLALYAGMILPFCQ